MRAITAALIFLTSLPISLQAAAPVSEIGNESGYTPAPRPIPVPVASAEPQDTAPPVGDTHYQLQMLQDEVRTLRGMVEELANEIKRLKSRQLDDYMDLDRRVSALTTAGPIGQSQGTPSSQGSAATASAGSPVAAKPAGDESAHYTQAYKLLKAGKTDEAKAAFKAHVERFPSGAYTANAHYWLGEIYLLQSDLEQARQSFNTVVSSYPAHRKASDATFKLGQAYHLMGNDAKAKSMLEKAAAGDDNAAKLARRYLQQNF